MLKYESNRWTRRKKNIEGFVYNEAVQSDAFQYSSSDRCRCPLFPKALFFLPQSKFLEILHIKKNCNEDGLSQE
jgi:hypothetical protein